MTQGDTFNFVFDISKGLLSTKLLLNLHPMKTKLGYLCSSVSWGGLEMNHLRNAVWMRDRGHEVLFFCVKDSRIDELAQKEGLQIQYIQYHKKYYDFKNAKRLIALLVQEKITHLLIRSNRDMSITATAKRKLGGQLHTSYFMEMQLGVKKTGLSHTLRYKYIDLWSSPLHWLNHQVETMTNFRNTRVVIPSGLELSQFESAVSKEEHRSALELPSDALLFGLIGRFDPQKGQLLALQALQEMKNQDAHLVLLGEPTLHEGDDYYQEMLNFIAENKLEDRVHLRPFMENPAAFYRSIDWLIMATKAETFGMVTIEALACGTPVLGSNAGGTPEILQTDQGGRLFETMNAADLAKQMDTIVNDGIHFNADKLVEMARVYDHRSVCTQVEQALKITC